MKKGDYSGRAIRKLRRVDISADLIVTIINIVEPKSGRSTHWFGSRASRRASRRSSICNGSCRKTGQVRVNRLNLLKTFRGECGGGIKTGVIGVGNTLLKKGDNRGRAIREMRSVDSISADLFVTIINIVEPKVGQRTGLAGPVAGAAAATPVAGRPAKLG